MQEINKDELLQFIAQAHRHTYAAPKEIRDQYQCVESILPGHRDFDFTEAKWRYHDSYAGHSYPPGKEIVFYNGQPVWCMSYQGIATDKLPSEFINTEVYSFLKKALMNFEDAVPFRGPAEFKEGDFRYHFEHKGDYKYFTGREAVEYKGEEVFFQDVMGSIID